MSVVGETVTGTVEKITPYGVIVRIDEQTVGLIHISQLDTRYVASAQAIVKKGDQIIAKVTGQREDGRLNLSRKEVLEDKQRIKKLKEKLLSASEPMADTETFDVFFDAFLQDSQKQLETIDNGEQSIILYN